MKRSKRRVNINSGMATKTPAIRDNLFKKAASAYRKGKQQKALLLLKKLLKNQSDHADALHLLGIISRENNDPIAALRHLRKSISLKPNSAAVHHNLGAALQDLGRLDEAEASYRKALRYNPLHAAAKSNLGLVLGRLDRVTEAITFLIEAVAANPQFPEAQNNLGLVLQQTGRDEDALINFNKAILLDPNQAEFHFNHARALHRTGQQQAAINAYDRCLALRPGWPRALWARMQALPMLYQNEDEIADYRSYWERNLSEFAGAIRLDTPEAINEAIIAVSAYSNFYLHYQGNNDCILQKKYGEVLTRVAQAAYPKYAKQRHRRTANTRQKLRIGFVSAFFHQHSVTKSHGNWIIDLDPERFECFVYHLGKKSDLVTEKIRDTSTKYHHLPGSVDDAIVAIDTDDLDVLIYLDIGMEPRIQVIAPLRLAPIQAMTWCHPVTSGLPSIDLFLTSALMEPFNGAGHYTERLVRLPNLSVGYRSPDVEEIKVGDIDDPNSNDAPIFLCSQSLFKLLPQFDIIFPRIAKEIGRCRFWFIAAMGERIGNRFRDRLHRVFSAYDLNADDHVHVFPHLSQKQFYQLNMAADVLLDSFLWSGFNSTMEAISCGLPVVTCPGPTMRSRHSAACLWRMDMPELVATDMDEYVSAAIAFSGITSQFGHWRRILRR